MRAARRQGNSVFDLASRVIFLIDPTRSPRQASPLPNRYPYCNVSKKTKDAATSESQPPDLEKSLAELEKIVERLEAGDLTLDDSLKQFERGVTLTRQCQTALRSAEQKVEILLRKSGASSAAEDGFEAVPFDDDIDDKLGDETP
jgi:exodeoxyribonuclease VII small subunit